MGEVVELLAVLGEQLRDLRVRVLDDPVDLLIDQRLGVSRGLARTGKRRPLSVAGQDGDWADFLAHPPAADHLARDLGELLEVRFGAVRVRRRRLDSEARGQSSAGSRSHGSGACGCIYSVMAIGRKIEFPAATAST